MATMIMSLNPFDYDGFIGQDGEDNCYDDNIFFFEQVKQAFVRDLDGYYLEFCRLFEIIFLSNNIFVHNIPVVSKVCVSHTLFFISVAKCLRPTLNKHRVRFFRQNILRKTGQ